MKALALIRMAAGGVPDVNLSVTPIKGYALGGTLGGWGLYVVTGTGPQLTALQALTQVIGIVAVTDNGAVHWGELDGVIASTVRTKINAWLTAHGYATIPVGWTNRQVIRALINRMTDGSDIGGFDVVEGG